MGKYEKLLQRILSGTSDNNIKFSEICQLLKKLGFSERIKGDHYIFTKNNIEEIISLGARSLAETLRVELRK